MSETRTCAVCAKAINIVPIHGWGHAPHICASCGGTTAGVIRGIEGFVEAERRNRLLVGTAYPTPTTAHNMAFAVTEGGEIDDARLRMSADYLRNDSAKQPELEIEVGQFISQIASALLTLEQETPMGSRATESRIDAAQARADILLALARIAWASEEKVTTRSHLEAALRATCDLCVALDIDPQGALDAAHAKRLRKVGIPA